MYNAVTEEYICQWTKILATFQSLLFYAFVGGDKLYHITVEENLYRKNEFSLPRRCGEVATQLLRNRRTSVRFPAISLWKIDFVLPMCVYFWRIKGLTRKKSKNKNRVYFLLPGSNIFFWSFLFFPPFIDAQMGARRGSLNCNCNHRTNEIPSSRHPFAFVQTYSKQMTGNCASLQSTKKIANSSFHSFAIN
jgi:hypothetical protein